MTILMTPKGGGPRNITPQQMGLSIVCSKLVLAHKYYLKHGNNELEALPKISERFADLIIFALKDLLTREIEELYSDQRSTRNDILDAVDHFCRAYQDYLDAGPDTDFRAFTTRTSECKRPAEGRRVMRIRIKAILLTQYIADREKRTKQWAWEEATRKLRRGGDAIEVSGLKSFWRRIRRKRDENSNSKKTGSLINKTFERMEKLKSLGSFSPAESRLYLEDIAKGKDPIFV